MLTSRRLAFLAAVSVGVIGGAAVTGGPAHAEFIVTIEQVGSNVVVNGSGSIDLTDLTPGPTGGIMSGIVPDLGAISIGSPNAVNSQTYYGTSEPQIFGSGGDTIPSSSGGGDNVSFYERSLTVPAGYVSGTALSDSSTYDSATFASLGLTDGNYTITWGSGADADGLLLEIDPAMVPEPASAALLALPFATLGLWRRGRRAL
jgi:hypothetical protein